MRTLGTHNDRCKDLPDVRQKTACAAFIVIIPQALGFGWLVGWLYSSGFSRPWVVCSPLASVQRNVEYVHRIDSQSRDLSRLIH
jgi:hypothetical protein